jgi:hypothetical protein
MSNEKGSCRILDVVFLILLLLIAYGVFVRLTPVKVTPVSADIRGCRAERQEIQEEGETRVIYVLRCEAVDVTMDDGTTTTTGATGDTITPIPIP